MGRGPHPDVAGSQNTRELEHTHEEEDGVEEDEDKYFCAVFNVLRFLLFFSFYSESKTKRAVASATPPTESRHPTTRSELHDDPKDPLASHSPRAEQQKVN